MKCGRVAYVRCAATALHVRALRPVGNPDFVPAVGRRKIRAKSSLGPQTTPESIQILNGLGIAAPIKVKATLQLFD
jgi:hypothetical protein